MTKKFYMLLLCAVILAVLTSCGIPKPPNEKQIAEELPDEITTIIIKNPFDATNLDIYEMEVASLSIERRQTNEKDDVVYCMIDLENEYYSFKKYVKLQYNYYDTGGWIIDDWAYYNDTIYQVKSNPFSEDLASQKWSYLYDEASLIDVSLDANNNSLTFTLEVNANHNHAVVGGKLIDTYTFDGTRWLENYDDSGCSTDWHIVGDWEYLIPSESGIYVYGCEMYLESFDQTTGRAEGVCSFYSSGLAFTHVEQFYAHHDLLDAEIEISEDSITIAWGYDQVRIGLDDASCEFLSGGHVNQISDLQFIDRTVDKTSGFDSQDVAAWKNYIDSYFERIETDNREEIINYLSYDVGVLGDGMSWLWEEHLIQYSIGGIHHSPGFTALRRDEVLDVIDMFSDANIGSLDDYAEIYVNAEFEDIGTVLYVFAFINIGGEWKLPAIGGEYD